MALAQLHFFAPSIGAQSIMNIILPDAGKGPFPVLYLLHGLSDDHSIWLRRTSIERHVAGMPLVVVMPGVHRGWYTNWHANPELRYEDFIMKDVMGFVERTFPVKTSRAGRCIGGLSMGGYGALKLALKYPETFISAHSHSGALLTPLHKSREWGPNPSPLLAESRRVFGPKHFGGPNDLVALSRKCPKAKRPALRLDCGLDDFLLQQNRHFATHLKAIRYNHEYAEFPGAHTWAYWDEHVQEALAFHRRYLKI